MINIAFDLRDPDRSGIARVARSLARALARQLERDPRFALTLCGPVRHLERLGARDWSASPPRLVDWASERHSFRSQLHWNAVRRQVGDAVWFFPQWDVPWYALPSRYVVMVHDLILLRVPHATSSIRRRLARRWIQRAVIRASRVVVPSASTARDVAAFMPSAAVKTAVITEGIEPCFFGTAPALPSEMVPFAAAGPFMLSVGNRKHHKNLIQGVELLARIPELRWIVAGERFSGWDAVDRRARETGVGSRMLVLDPITDRVLHALYAHALCLFFPSRMEGWGLPVAEAIANGTPVVCSNTSSLPEVAGACAAYCDPDDTLAFERAIRELLKSPGRQKGGCIERVRAMTWDQTARQLLHVIEQTI